MIEFEEISVVIQGPIYEYTYRVCESVRKYMPGAEIILSTWKQACLENLDYDVFVENEDPGNFTFILSQQMDNGSSLYQMNINRQILSTINGIKKSNRKYICKLRSDTVLKGINFLKEYQKYNAPIKSPYNKLLLHRVVTLSTVNPRRRMPFLFYLCDWFFFGLKEDMFNIWDIPLIKEFNGEMENGYYRMDLNFGNEQYLWLGFLAKVFKIHIKTGKEYTGQLLVESEKSYANCCIFLTAKKAQIQSLKIGRSGYGAPPCLSNAGLYTIHEWKKLYNKYGNGKVMTGWNLFEEILFFLSDVFRKLKKTRFQYFYRILADAYRKMGKKT